MSTPVFIPSPLICNPAYCYESNSNCCKWLINNISTGTTNLGHGE